MRPFFGRMAAFSPVPRCTNSKNARTRGRSPGSQMASHANRSPSPAPSPSGSTSGSSLFTVAGPRRTHTGFPFKPMWAPWVKISCTTSNREPDTEVVWASAILCPRASRRHSDGLTWMAASRPSFLAGPSPESVLLAELIPRTALLATIWRAAAANSQKRCDWFYFFVRAAVARILKM